MTVLLDENIPIGLLHELRAAGVEAEHIITLGWRGVPDSRIRERLADSTVLLLTPDDDFLVGASVQSTVVVSRVHQSRRLSERVAIWLSGLLQVIRTPPGPELLDDGRLVPWPSEANVT